MSAYLNVGGCCRWSLAPMPTFRRLAETRLPQHPSIAFVVVQCQNCLVSPSQCHLIASIDSSSEGKWKLSICHIKLGFCTGLVLLLSNDRTPIAPANRLPRKPSCRKGCLRAFSLAQHPYKATTSHLPPPPRLRHSAHFAPLT